MKFCDVHAGQVIEASSYWIGQQKVISFARAFDPQWFHTDRDAVARERFRGLIASGWHTCSIAMCVAANAALHGAENLASPGGTDVRWPLLVRPGYSLPLKATVRHVRRSRKHP